MKLKTQPVKKQGSPTSMREANLALQDENERLKKEIKELKESTGPNQNDLDLLSTKHSNEKSLLKDEIQDLREKISQHKETELKLKKEIESLKIELTKANKNKPYSSNSQKEQISIINTLKLELTEKNTLIDNLRENYSQNSEKISKENLEEILSYCKAGTKKMLIAVCKLAKQSNDEWIKVPNTHLQRESSTKGAVAMFKKEVQFFKMAMHKKDTEDGRKIIENFYKLNLSEDAISYLLN